jgi:hypothetical protein
MTMGKLKYWIVPERERAMCSRMAEKISHGTIHPRSEPNLSEDVVHGLAGVGVVFAKNSEETQDFHLKNIMLLQNIKSDCLRKDLQEWVANS